MMPNRPYLFGSLVLAGISAIAFGALVLTLPATTASATPVAISADETAATLAALKPPKRTRPVIAVIGANAGTETTDYLIPFGVLKRADIGEVVALGTQSGAITMMPALKIMPDATIKDFDARYPEGADYVIVPAMHHDNDPAVLRWIKQQAAGGATIIGICAGARIVGNAGLLDGRNATTHWYDVAGLRKRHPTMHYIANRRFVVDRGVATTTGVSASIPISLTLIEAIAGHERAAAVARDLGVDNWDARHDSSAFRLNRGFVLAIAGNGLAFWERETLGLKIEPGVDEVALALTADAWSRTYRSKASIYAATAGAVRTQAGIGILPDHVGDAKKHWLPPLQSTFPAKALDAALDGIAARYGRQTWRLVATQLEYPAPAPRMPQK